MSIVPKDTTLAGTNKEFGGVQEGCFERFWEQVEAQRDQHGVEYEQHDVE